MDETGEQPEDFAAGYEAAAQRLLSCIERACGLVEQWPARVRVAIESSLSLLAHEPALARVLLIEPYGRGVEVQLRHEETLGRLVELLRVGREEVEAPILPDTLEEGLVGGAIFIVGRPLRACMPEQLPELAPDITALLLTPYIGREEAELVAAGGDPLG